MVQKLLIFSKSRFLFAFKYPNDFLIQLFHDRVVPQFRRNLSFDHFGKVFYFFVLFIFAFGGGGVLWNPIINTILRAYFFLLTKPRTVSKIFSKISLSKIFLKLYFIHNFLGEGV